MDLQRLMRCGSQKFRRYARRFLAGAHIGFRPRSRGSGPEIHSYISAVPSFPSGHDGNRQLVEFFLHSVESLSPTVFCDIGANRGEIAAAVKAMLPETEVHAFEANPHTFTQHADAQHAAGVVWNNIAISNRRGEVDVYIPRQLSRRYSRGAVRPARVEEPLTTGKASIHKRREDAVYDVVSVRSQSLDEYFEGIRASATFALWIDVEGAAQLVLGGASAVLRQTSAILVELEALQFWDNQTSIQWVFDTLVAHGFEPIARDREYDDAQFNVMFVRREQLPRMSENVLAERISGAALCEANRQVSSRVFGRRRPSIHPEDVPVIVPCFNNPTDCARMLAQLRRVGFRDICFVDSGSTTDSMVSWLDEAEGHVRIERTSQNRGPRRAVLDDGRLAALPRYFCVTDPDLAFNGLLPSDFLQDLALQTSRFRIGKAGFALDLMRRIRFRDEPFEIMGKSVKIWEWEEQFWSRPLGDTLGGDMVFLADIDTTFALYDQKFFCESDFLAGVRVAGRFTAQHLPWLRSADVPPEEIAQYRASQKFSYYRR